MVKQITKYVCDDGREFSTLSNAQRYEALMFEANMGLNPINPRIELNSNEYVQHSARDCDAARSTLYAIVRREFPEDSAKFLPESNDRIAPQNCFTGRLLDDANSPILKAWNRLCCINWSNYREYEQPYFASHPEEATVCKDDRL